ncbi:cytochrome c oxidase subunit 3 [Ilumatobacter nonamiensis]|uniref:cytochrome c oxidase subunit 3 n=1 Tax=Ilumatobacter nonamiensis TaxID=467093 RepID=UPI000347922A|nr:cytochrome c oxidase subunit 3 [Ilumatobacter nonamiensis]
MEALAAGPAPAPRNQLTVASVFAAVAMIMLTGGMLGVWAVKRSAVVDAGESWLPSGVTVPEVPTNVILIAFPALCSFAQWAVWASKRNDKANTVFALGTSAFVALLIVNAQAFVWNQMGVVVADGEYGSMFYALTGTFMALMVVGLLLSLVSMFRYLAGRTRDREILIAHAIFWYAMTAVYTAIWFLVYVTK